MRPVAIAILCVTLTTAGLAQPAPTSRPAPLSGPVYDNPAAGISFRAPPGCRSVETSDDSQIARYLDPSRRWDLKVAVWHAQSPLPLKSDRKNAPATQPGLLDMTLQQTLKADPDAQILESKIITTGQATVGILAFQSKLNQQPHLTQIALVQKSPTTYYIFNLTTPQTNIASTSPTESDPAVQAFQAMLRSIHLLDQARIHQDQVKRLLRTRALLGQWTKARVEGAMVQHQWQRILRDGKDIGYSYIVEKPERRGNADGVNIGVRSRLMQADGGQVDTESWFYSNIDRKHASWSTVVRVSNTKGNVTAYGTEIGAADENFDFHRLTVKTIRKSGDTKPVERDLPPWYLPQAFTQLLPRLLPLDKPQSYLFASYVSANREVMSRYVEVLPAKTVTIHGRQVEAIPIHDRFGLNGTITTHYFTPDGHFLADRTLTEQTDADGGVRSSTLLVLPSTREELLKIWAKADLSEPSLPNNGGKGR